MTTLFIIGGIALLLVATILILMFTIKFDSDHNASMLSWHYRLFNVLRCADSDDINNQPTNICSYFWKYVQYVISLPLTILTVLLGIFIKAIKGTDKLYGVSIVFYFWIILGILVGDLLFIPAEGPAMFTFFVASLLGLLIFTTSIALIAIIIVGAVEGIGTLRENYRGRKTERMLNGTDKSMLTVRLKSWKDRNCALINWE